MAGTASNSASGTRPAGVARVARGARARLRGSAEDRVRRPRSRLRGGPGDPRWSRPGLIVVGVLAGVLVFWGLTANGYANNWYAEGALAASRSWKAFVDNAVDLSDLVSLDKGPLSDWMMGLSGRIFGFSSFSMLLPDALCGIASVALLHEAVRRTLGHRAALVAALVLALSPVSIVMDRYNAPDALLALLLIASAWALVRVLESGRLRHLLLCGALVGLAFNTKMLEAYLIVPGLTAAFGVAGRGGWRRRLGHLLLSGAVMGVMSFAWFTTMMLIPAADRPWVGSTTSNSWFSLIFGYNGLSRLTGTGSGGGLARLFTGPSAGGQIGWLLLFALAGLLAGLWVTRRAAREDRRRAAHLLFGLWGLAGFVVFSFSRGTFLPYYTNAMAPAVAALCGGGGVLLFDRFRGGWGWTAALSAAVAGTAVVSFPVLRGTSSFAPWMRWAVVGAAGAAVAGIIALRAGARGPEPRQAREPEPKRSRRPEPRRARRGRWGAGQLVGGLVLGAGAVALLGGPTAYAVATVGYGQAGGDPAAGPEPEVGAPPAAALNTPSAALVAYLKAHRDGARYLVAANGSQAAAPIALATGEPVTTMGGFSESGTAASVPAPTVDQLRRLIARGAVRLVIPGPRSFSAAPTGWVRSHCRAVAVPGGGAGGARPHPVAMPRRARAGREPAACSPELPREPGAAAPGGRLPRRISGYENSQDGRRCPADKLVITPRTPVRNGRLFTITVDYTGTPGVHHDGDGSEEGWFRAPDGNWMASEPVGSEDWMPLNDYPTAKPTYDFSITTERGRTAIANGQRVSVTDHPPDAQFPHGSATPVWSAPMPIASYLALTIVGDYTARVRTVDSRRYYAFQDRHISTRLRARNARIIARLPQITRSEERLSGPFPFASDGGVTGPPGVSSSDEEMESMSVFPWVPGGLNTSAIVYHENFHQWWGDNVSDANFDMTFFKEGMATLAVQLDIAQQVAQRSPGGAGSPAGHAAFERYLAEQFDALYASGPGFWQPAPSRRTPATYLDLDAVYERPKAALIALRQILGPQRFDAALRSVQHRYAGRAITEPQAEAAFTERLPNHSAACRARLARFFTEWFDTAYHGSKPQITGPGLHGQPFYARRCGADPSRARAASRASR
jgi:4-amino-4-deoxy-L-arabinose transferase-like glycosyltransferase